MKKKILLITAVIILISLITSCIPGDGKATPEHPANMLWGIWHGWIAPLSLILSLFRDRSIFEVNNTGFWYELGFYAAVISGFGGLNLSRKKRKTKKGNWEE